MRIRFQVMLLTIVVLGVYYPALHAPMNSVDDPGMLLYLLNTDSFSLRDLFLSGGSGYYRPLLQLSFLFDKYVWGLEESFMHLDNILLHLLNTLLLFALVRRVCLSRARPTGCALAAALLFAVHPINTESVSWISGRTDPLAACFLLLSLLVTVCRSRPVLTPVAAALLMFLGCLVKETGIFYLPAALLFPFFFTEGEARGTLWQTLRGHWLHFASFLSCGGAYFLLRSLAHVQGDRGVAHVVSAVAATQERDPLLQLTQVLKAVGFYAKKLVFPFPLNFGITHISDGYALLGGAVLLFLIWLLFRRSVPSFFGLCAASIGCSALLVVFLNATWTPLAERYMYIPCAFFLAGCTLSLQQWPALNLHRAALPAVTWLIVAGAAWGSFSRNLIWQDNLALYQDTVRQSPDFTPARNELALALKQKGRSEEAREILKSLQPEGAVKNYQYGMMSKAGAYIDSGDFQQGRRILREVLKTPGELETLILEKMLEANKLEVARGKTTSAAVYAETVQCLTRLYQIDRNPFYQYRLGVTHLHQKQEQKALAAFQEVCRTAAEQAYYRKPAEKLVATLSAKQSGTTTGGNL